MCHHTLSENIHVFYYELEFLGSKNWVKIVTCLAVHVVLMKLSSLWTKASKIILLSLFLSEKQVDLRRDFKIFKVLEMMVMMVFTFFFFFF